MIDLVRTEATSTTSRAPWRELLLALCLWALVGARTVAGAPDVRILIARTGISKGICSVPQCGPGDLAAAIAAESELLVHAFDRDRADVDQAARRPKLLAVEWLATGRMPYVDDFVDLAVVDTAASGTPASEIFRVLRPRGCAILRGGSASAGDLATAGFEVEDVKSGWQIARKPARSGADDWSHWFHGPDNNPVSQDTVIQSPYVTQWLAKPYYHAMPVVSTAAAGRVFVATGHIAHHDREIPTLNTLVARNGYNGRILWQRKLPQGYLVHRSAFIATGDALYMAAGDEILLLDPETGRELERVRVPGTRGKLMWMAKVDDILYVLTGHGEPPTETMEVHANWRGWGWHNVDKNYSPEGKHQIRWGFGDMLAAYDLTRREVVWTHRQANMDSRGVAILRDRLFYYVPGSTLACLDRHRGSILWRNEDREHLALIEEEAKGLKGTPGFRTTPMLLATPVGLFVQGQKRMNVLGFSVEDGRFRWAKRKFHNNPNLLYTRGKLFISGIEKNGSVQVIDPVNGDSLENLNFWKGSCTRLTGSPEALYCRGEGLGRYDFAKKVYWAERSARPGCNDGATPANGLLYVGPWLCDCNLSILGQMALAPARGFDAHTQTPAGNSLESIRELSDGPIADERDWPAYRGNNQRTASSASVAPSTASLLWRREGRAPSAPPIAVGDRVFVASEDGLLRCLDSKKGAVS